MMLGRGGGENMCALITCRRSPPVSNGARPVRHSYSRQVNEYTSGGRPDLPAAEPFRCHVRARPDDQPRRRHARVAAAVGDAEVDQIREVIRREEDVLRLDVAVHQAVGVRGVQSGRHLRDDRRGPRRLQRPVRPQLVLQAAALDQPHVDVEHSVDVAEVVHRDDVRFLQPRSYPRLAPETFLVARISGHLRAQELDGHHPLPDGVVGAVHLTHPTDTDQRVQLVGPESGAQPRAAVRGGHCQILSVRSDVVTRHRRLDVRYTCVPASDVRNASVSQPSQTRTNVPPTERDAIKGR